MAGSEQRSFSGDGAVAELLRLLLRSRVEEEEREERAIERVEWPGGAGRRPDQVKAVGRGASNAGARRAPCAGERGEGKRATLSGWAEREAGRPSSACPLSLFFNFFSQILSKFIWTI